MAADYTLKREDPPAPKRANRLASVLAAALQTVADDPGNSYRIGVYGSASSASTAARNLRETTNGFSFTTRRIESGCALYAVFEGEKGEAWGTDAETPAPAPKSASKPARKTTRKATRKRG